MDSQTSGRAFVFDPRSAVPCVFNAQFHMPSDQSDRMLVNEGEFRAINSEADVCTLRPLLFPPDRLVKHVPAARDPLHVVHGCLDKGRALR